MSTRELHRTLWDKGVMLNISKWLGKYDVIFEGKVYVTDVRTINGNRKQTIQYFVDFYNNIKQGYIKPVHIIVTN